MNSQFSNSNFGRVLYVAIISLIVAATIFVVWYMVSGYKLGTYEPDTRLGSVYIGGLSENEVVPRLDDKISYWYNDETIVFELTYQGYTYEFNRNLFLFDTEASIYGINEGTINEIVVYYQGADRESVEQEIHDLNFLQNVDANIDIQQLINDIIKDASFMKSYSSKNVEDYLLDVTESIEDIDTAAFSIPEGVEIDVLVSKVLDVFEDGMIVIPSKELFDISDVFGDVMNDAEMSVLASAMLELVVDTNFIINEVHYEPTIDFTTYTIENYPYYGRNTHVNQVVNESFSFYNPNASNYYFAVSELTEFNGDVTLSGLPFEYVIDIEVSEVELDYITQGTNDITLLQNGWNGYIYQLTRVVTDINGEIVYDEMIVFEFYPPIKEIIPQQ